MKKNIIIFLIFYFLSACSDNTENIEQYSEIRLSPLGVSLDEEFNKPMFIFGGKEPFRIEWKNAEFALILGLNEYGQIEIGDLTKSDPQRLPIFEIIERKVVFENVYGVDTVFTGWCSLKDASGQTINFVVSHSCFPGGLLPPINRQSNPRTLHPDGEV